MNASRPSRTRRTAAGVLGIIAVGALIIIARPFVHLTRTMVDERSLAPVPQPPPGFADDASRMERTAIAEVVTPRTAEDVRDAIARAADAGLGVSIAGARHTMGGHTIAAGGLVIDMSALDGIAVDGDVVEVGAGARWCAILDVLDTHQRSIGVMQSNCSFSVGGSIGANCHGWQLGRPPIISTVESFRLVTADGRLLTCSRDENAELFGLVAGGYGLFGVMVDVRIRTVPNVTYRMTSEMVAGADVGLSLARAADDAERGRIGMAYARMKVTDEDFLGEAIVTLCSETDDPPVTLDLDRAGSFTQIKRAVFRGSSGSSYGKALRWNAERLLGQRLGETTVTRNELLAEGVEVYGNRDPARTDILHEYFVPPAAARAFVDALRGHVPGSGCDLLNVTVRLVERDDDSVLRYADQRMIAFVLLFDQARSPQADTQMSVLTQRLVDAALELGGRHYLPYRLHATPEQVRRGYPMLDELLEAKRTHDPDERFRNAFYDRYRAD